MPSHVLGDAADHEPAQQAALVRTHEDHVDVLCLCSRDDGFTGGSRPHEEIHLHTDISAALDQPPRDRLATVTHLVYANAEAPAREDQVVGVDHADDEQRCIIPARELERPLGGEVRGGRQVGGKQDPPQCQRGSGAGRSFVRR